MTEQIVKRRDKRALILGLVHLGNGLCLFLGLVLIAFLLPYLPSNSPVKGSGGGDIAAFIIIPISFGFTLLGLIMTIVALARKREPRPKLELNNLSYIAVGLVVLYYPLIRATVLLGDTSQYISIFLIPVALILGLISRTKGITAILISIAFVEFTISLLVSLTGF